MLVIFAGGQVNDYQKIKQQLDGIDYVICADSGTRHAQALGITPNLIVGDMDSISINLLHQYQGNGIEIQQYPKEKDEVDTELAIIEAVKRGYKEILLLGATGGRVDHSMANIHLLIKAAKMGVRVTILDEYHRIYLITPMPASIQGSVGGLVSLLPVTNVVTGVYSQGLKWELQDRTFEIGNPFGISNQLTATNAQIKVKQGFLLAIEIYNTSVEVNC